MLDYFSRLNVLKRKAKRLHHQLNQEYDLDCGAVLTEYIRPSIIDKRKEFNEVWDELRKIDPSAPESPWR